MPTGYTTVTASKIQDASGALLAGGRVTFYPVSSQGVPISAIADPADGGGAILQSGVVFLVVNGAITTDLFGNPPQVADTSLTSPQNIAYRITITDASGVDVQGPGYGLVQPTGTTWSLDTYQPNNGSLTTTVVGATGPAGPPGSPSPSSGMVLINTSTSVPFTLGISGGELALMPTQPVLIDSITGQLWQLGVAADSAGVNRVTFTLVSSALFPVASVSFYDVAAQRIRTLTMASGTYVITSLGAGAGFGNNNFAEVPAGAVNGVNTVFTLTHAPVLLSLFRNGLFRMPGGVDYTLAGNTITYGIAPQPGDNHFAQYVY
jgi:hypothetical protein